MHTTGYFDTLQADGLTSEFSLGLMFTNLVFYSLLILCFTGVVLYTWTVCSTTLYSGFMQNV